MGGGGGGGGGGGPRIPPPQFIFKSAPDEQTGIVHDVYQNYQGQRIFKDPNWVKPTGGRTRGEGQPFVPFEGRHPNEQAKVDNERYVARRKETENRVRSAKAGGTSAASKLAKPSAAFVAPGKDKKVKSRVRSARSGGISVGSKSGSQTLQSQATLGKPTLLGT